MRFVNLIFIIGENIRPLYFTHFRSTLRQSRQIQNSLARTVMKAPKSCHITPILRSLHWLRITERIEYKLFSLIPTNFSQLPTVSVYIQGNFSCDMHFKHIITVSSQRLHILKALRRQGLSLELLHCVFHAIIANKITFAISAWYGCLNNSHVLQINSIFKRAFKYGYVKCVIKLEELLQDYDDKLFTKATQGNHAMHHLLPSSKSTCYNLRTLGHGLSVNSVKSK